MSEASPLASITFVHDEDVVADSLPETPISAGEKKLEKQDADFSSDEEDCTSLKDAEGYTDLLQFPAYVTHSIEFIYHQDGVKVRIQKKMCHFRNKVL